MILLQKGNSLNHAGWFMPESMPLQLNDSAISTASITIGPEAPEITVGDWLLDDSGGPGDGIVWRAKGMETNYATETRTVTLEHVLATLQDEILSGEHTTNAISGKGTATARQALEYALKGQSVWVLGDCEFDRSLPYSFTNTTRYAAITTVSGTLADWCWEYDLKKLPFKLHVRKKSSEVGCELRMGRNLTTLKMTVDRSQMYTRFYPVGQRSKMLPEKYLEKNTKYYGVIEHTATDQSKTSEAMLRAWAEEMLDRHAEPSVSVSISGLELSAATGEPLDRLRLGKVCRVPLPRYGVTIRERITKLQWSDALRDPVTVSVTLANSVTDVSTIIKQISGSSSSNASGSAKAQEEDHAWIVDTADHVGLVAEAIVGREGETVDWSRVSSIIVDGEGIHQRVTKAQNDIITAQTAIEMNENAITLEAQRAEAAEAVLRSSITVEAGRITSLVERTGVGSLDDDPQDTLFSRITQTVEAITSEVTRATAAEGTLSSRITQTAEAITSEVTRATAAEGSLSSRITQTAEAITSEVTRATAAEGSLSSRITQTATEISSLVERTGVGSLGAQETLYSRITQTATAIASEVSRATAEEGALSSRITQTATEISSLVERTGVDSLGAQETLYSRITQTATAITSEVTRATAAEGTMSSRITQNANRIALVVTSSGGTDVLDVASIVAGINDQSGSYVKIKAKYINLDGYVTASDLSATNAVINNLTTGKSTATKMLAKTLGCTTTFIYKGYKADWKSHTFVTSCSITMPSVTLSDPHYFIYSNSDSMTPAGRTSGRVVTNYTAGSASINSATLYFLERGDAE